MGKQSDEVFETLRVFLADGQVTEMRAFDHRGAPVSACFYRDHRLMAGRAPDAEREASGVYFVPNPIRDDVIPPGKTHTQGSANADRIVSRRWLLIDSDPVRFGEGGRELADQKVPSSDAERDAAWNLIWNAKELCAGAGFVNPVLGDSGNGWHLCYPIDLPNDQPSYALVEQFLAGLDARLGTREARIDQRTKDAPRLWKLYGTRARKSKDESPGRPFRKSRLVEGSPWSADAAAQNVAALNNLTTAWRLQDAANRSAGGEAMTPIQRAMAYIEKEDVAIDGRGGSDRCYHVVAILIYGFGLSDSEAMAAIAPWNSRCLPPWNEKELLHKIAGVRKKPPDKPVGYLLNASPAGGGGGAFRVAGLAGDGKALPPADKLLVRASSVEPRPVEWLWPSRIPLGKMTTFAGQGGLGKTFCLLAITSAVTTGAAWPDGQPGCDAGDVLFISGEDDNDDTLVPRLIEMGADLDRVHFLSDEAQAAFHLGKVTLFDELVRAIGTCRLVVIDPPTSYLGGVDDHKNADLRQVLTPLKNLASRLRVAVVFNTHVNKGGGQKIEAMSRVMGSVAWVNAVRAAHMFAKDPEDHTGERRLFCPLKMNAGREPKAMAYRIAATSGDLARVEWLGEVSTTADQAVNREKAKPRAAVASEWLVEQFRAQREWASNDLIRAGRENGISRDALFEAKERLGLPKPRKRVPSNGDTVWVWWVPEDWERLRQDASASDDEPARF